MGKERFKKGLDEIDFELIRELELDARQSYEELANGLGTSPSTVGRRLQRLSEKRIIDIVTVPNALALGYKTRVTFAINAHPGKTDEVAKMVSGYPNVQHVIVTIGRYDMIVLAVFQDQQRLFSFVTTELGNISGLANVETLMSLKLAKSSWVYLSDADYRFEEQNYYDLDYFDLKLIKALEDNPRCRITNLASQIGMSRPTTHHRLQNLIGAAC